MPFGPVNYDAVAVVYLVTNKVNGKRYIGVTTQSVQGRLKEHFCHAKMNRNNGHFYRAIRKHGVEVFEVEVLKECISKREALETEIRLIAELKPEYNSTKGGDGQLGRPMSALGRKKISQVHKGNKYRLGQKHTEKTIDRLKEISREPAQKARWAIFSGLGPIAASRKVICHDDGIIYKSASAAAEHYGVAKSSLIELCLRNPRRKSVGGMRFSYVETIQ
jgi:group I intron endonuclease